MMKRIFIILFVFAALISKAQVYQTMPQFGYQFKRIKIDSTLHIPSFCGVPSLRNSAEKEGAIAIDTCNNILYKYTRANGWSVVGGGSGGGSGTVTSISGGYGISNTPSIITNTGTIIVDSAILSQKYLRISDYISIDTTSISNRINAKADTSLVNLKVNISDTAYMLSNYLHIIDTTNKWVSSVTKLNDSTIRVVKDGTTNDLLIKGSVISTSGFVPYTGATQDLDMGIHQVNAQSFYANGSNGNGNIHLKHQNADATGQGQTSTIWADNNGNFNWLNANASKSIFFTSNQTANRTYTFQDKSYTLADNADLANKLNISDTSNMLLPYQRSISAMKYTDTASMLTNYVLGSGTGGRLSFWNGTRLLSSAANYTIGTTLTSPYIYVSTTSGTAKANITPTSIFSQKSNDYSGSVIDTTTNTPYLISYNSTANKDARLYANYLSFKNLSNGSIVTINAPNSSSNRTINFQDKSYTIADSADVTLKANLSQGRYTMLANNTNGTANMSSQPFYDAGSQTYSGTITWNQSSPPSGTTNHSYRWTQVGKLVTLQIALVYGTASGVSQTTVQMALPSDCPTPITPSGMTATNLDILYFGTGNYYTSINAIPTTSGFVVLRGTAAGGYEVVCTRAASAANVRYVNVTVQYFTNTTY